MKISTLAKELKTSIEEMFKYFSKIFMTEVDIDACVIKIERVEKILSQVKDKFLDKSSLKIIHKINETKNIGENSMLDLIFNNLKTIGEELYKVEDSALDTAKSILSDTIDTVEKGIDKIKSLENGE